MTHAVPIEQPTKFELVLNLKTAKTIRLTISPVILVRVDDDPADERRKSAVGCAAHFPCVSARFRRTLCISATLFGDYRQHPPAPTNYVIQFEQFCCCSYSKPT